MNYQHTLRPASNTSTRIFAQSNAVAWSEMHTLAPTTACPLYTRWPTKNKHSQGLPATTNSNFGYFEPHSKEIASQKNESPNRNSCIRKEDLCRASAKAVLLLLAIPPTAILWNYKIQHEVLLGHQVAATSLPTQWKPAWPASLVVLFRHFAALTKEQVEFIAESISKPGTMELYSAVLSLASLFSMYSEIGERSRLRVSLISLCASLCPVSGVVLGFGWLGCVLVLLPLHIIVALVASDVCGCFGVGT